MAIQLVQYEDAPNPQSEAEAKAVEDLLREIESWRDRLKKDARATRIMQARPWWSPRSWGAYAHWSWALSNEQKRKLSGSLDPLRDYPAEIMPLIKGPFGMDPALRRLVCNQYVAGLGASVRSHVCREAMLSRENDVR